ncbi:Core-2/I-Branching enzyme [Cooperia oncophora]
MPLQYLSGVDVPLRTNLEMVQIFKRLNETVNTFVEPFPLDRLQTREASESPLPLIKSPLSLLLPRRTVKELVNTPLSKALLNYLSPTYIADESFWATMLGNPLQFNITGSFDGKRILAFQKLYALEHPVEFNDYTSSIAAMNGYISRYQVWTIDHCKGAEVVSTTPDEVEAP